MSIRIENRYYKGKTREMKPIRMITFLFSRRIISNNLYIVLYINQQLQVEAYYNVTLLIDNNFITEFLSRFNILIWSAAGYMTCQDQGSCQRSVRKMQNVPTIGSNLTVVNYYETINYTAQLGNNYVDDFSIFSFPSVNRIYNVYAKL